MRSAIFPTVGSPVMCNREVGQSLTSNRQACDDSGIEWCTTCHS